VDAIERAIAATDPQPQEQAGPPPIPMKTVVVTLDTTKRQVMVQVPQDLTLIELLDFNAWLSNPVQGLWSMLHPPSPIVDVAGRPFQS
jgi:hypothetical protein